MHDVGAEHDDLFAGSRMNGRSRGGRGSLEVPKRVCQGGFQGENIGGPTRIDKSRNLLDPLTDDIGCQNGVEVRRYDLEPELLDAQLDAVEGVTR